METNIFQKEALDIKPALLSKIVDEILREKEVTRNGVTSATGASATSVRKVFSALNHCGFTEEVSRPRLNSAKPCGHLCLREQVSVLILDLSAPIFGIGLMDSQHRCVLYEQHVYDREMTLSDNLIVFFSRVKPLIKKSRLGFCSVGVICADKELSSVQARNPALPTVSQDKETLDDLIRKIFGAVPTVYADLGDALRYAIHYNVLSVPGEDPDSAYIFVGSDLYAIALPDKKAPIPIRLSGLMPTSKTQLKDRMQVFHSKYSISNVLWRAGNLLDCMLNMRHLIVEYDFEKFDITALHRMHKAFSVTGHPEPVISTHKKAPGFAAIGLSLACIASLILSHFAHAPAQPEGEEHIR